MAVHQKIRKTILPVHNRKKQYGFTIFASELILHVLPKLAGNYFADGTHRVVIHVEPKKHVSIFSFTVMQYTLIFFIFLLFNYNEKNICKLNPVSMMTVYETAIRNAVRIVYPDSQVRSCYFHFTLAVRRHCRKNTIIIQENCCGCGNVSSVSQIVGDTPSTTLFDRGSVLHITPGIRISFISSGV